MKVINKTTKIIGIGDTALLPGEETTISDDVASSDMVQHFASIGKIALEPENGGTGDPPTDPPAPGNTGKRGKGGKNGKNSGKDDPPADPDGGKKDDGEQEGGTPDGSETPNGEA